MKSKRTVKNRHLEKHKSKASYIFTNIAEAVLIGIIVALLAYFIMMVNFTDSSAKAMFGKDKSKVYGITLNTLNTINFRGEYSATTVTSAQTRITELVQKRGKQKYPIYLVIDSPGGDIVAGMELINYINSYNNIHTITIQAMSMGALTAQLVKGQRYATEDATMMFHRAALGGLSGQVNDGEIESRLAYWKSMIRNLTNRTAARLGLSYDELQKRQKDEYWLYGSDIVSANAADYVVKLKCTKDLIAKKARAKIAMFIFEIDASFSECPLLRSPLIGE